MLTARLNGPTEINLWHGVADRAAERKVNLICFWAPASVRATQELLAVNQLNAEIFLNAVDRLRGGRLADVVELGPAGETLVLHDIAEDTERLDIHKGTLS